MYEKPSRSLAKIRKNRNHFFNCPRSFFLISAEIFFCFLFFSKGHNCSNRSAHRVFFVKISHQNADICVATTRGDSVARATFVALAYMRRSRAPPRLFVAASFGGARSAEAGASTTALWRRDIRRGALRPRRGAAAPIRRGVLRRRRVAHAPDPLAGARWRAQAAREDLPRQVVCVALAGARWRAQAFCGVWRRPFFC
jgi:hypothetical protein